MTDGELVCDASAMVAALVGATDDSEWCAGVIRGRQIWAPDLAAYEGANILRRHELAGLIGREESAQAHQDLVELPVRWWRYAPLCERAWELRGNLTIYDASYVALAEILEFPLCTLDRRLSRAPGIRCEVLTPPG